MIQANFRLQSRCTAIAVDKARCIRGQLDTRILNPETSQSDKRRLEQSGIGWNRNCSTALLVGLRNAKAQLTLEAELDVQTEGNRQHCGLAARQPFAAVARRDRVRQPHGDYARHVVSLVALRTADQRHRPG